MLTQIVKIKDMIALIGEEQMIHFILMELKNRKIRINVKILLSQELYQKFKRKLKIVILNRRKEQKNKKLNNLKMEKQIQNK